jgi:hypothetical protein
MTQSNGNTFDVGLGGFSFFFRSLRDLKLFFWHRLGCHVFLRSLLVVVVVSLLVILICLVIALTRIHILNMLKFVMCLNFKSV